MRTLIPLGILACFGWLNPLAVPAFAAERVGPEARVELPPSAKYNLIISDRPRDGEIVYINPPVIAWSYTPNPTNTERDQTCYTFQFQAAYEPTFANPIVNVRSKVNSYNWLAPFNNNLSPSNVVYWRVLYYRTNTVTILANSNVEVSKSHPETFSVGPIRSFVIAPNARLWDRSMMAVPSYIASKSGHPRIWFNAGNRRALSNWLETSTSESVAPFWQSEKSLAARSITNSWWTMPDPTTFGPRGANGIWLGQWPNDIARCAFVWQMTRDPRFLAEPANICQRASDAATWWLTNAWFSRDIVWAQSETWARGLPVMYDWLHEVMTPAQRSNVLFALEKTALFYQYGASLYSELIKLDAINWYDDQPMASYTYGFHTPPFISLKRGQPHPIVWKHFSIYTALAAFGDGPNSSELLLKHLDSALVRPAGLGTDENIGQSRGYSTDTAFNYPAVRGQIAAASVFPELHLEKNPYWAGIADWFSRLLPAGFYESNEPFNDVGQTAGYRSVWSRRAVGRDLGAFLNDGRWIKQHQSWGTFVPTTGYESFMELPTEFHFPPPAPVDNNVLNRAFLSGGYVAGGSKPPTAVDAYTDGVGYVLMARPSGFATLHDHPNDLNFQMWAYGVEVTESGYDMVPASKASWTHYVPAFNGLGTLAAGNYPRVEARSQILAFTNGGYFTYAAVDGRYSYPVLDETPGGWVVDGEYAAQHSGGPARALTRAQRHFLFVRNKYFVVFDDFAATTNSTYSWIWQVPTQSRNLTVDRNNGTFSYLGTNGARSITVMAKSFTAPALMHLNDQRGMDALVNPINGFSFVPKAEFTVVMSDLPRTNAIIVFNTFGPRNQQGQFSWLNQATFTFTTNQASVNPTNVYAGGSVRESLTNLVAAATNLFRSHPYEVRWNSADSVALVPEAAAIYHEYAAGWSPISAKTRPMISPRPAALWWNNAIPTTSWKTGWVIFPVKAGDPMPTITRLDDLTISVTNGAETDVISFDPNNDAATLIVDLAAMRLPGGGVVVQRPQSPPTTLTFAPSWSLR